MLIIISLEEKTISLEKELEEVKNTFKCQVCQEAYINVIILPCYHIYICKDCLFSIIDVAQPSIPKCPICNINISEYKDIYIPI